MGTVGEDAHPEAGRGGAAAQVLAAPGNGGARAGGGLTARLPLSASVPVAGPPTAAWREAALARAAQLRTQAAIAQQETEHEPAVADALATSIEHGLETACATALRRTRLAVARAAECERVESFLDLAELDVLRLAPRSTFEGHVPHLWATVRRYLPADDPRRLAVERILRPSGDPEVPPGRPGSRFEEEQREVLVDAMSRALAERRRRLQQVFALRNLLLVPVVLLVVIALGFAVLGAARPDILPLCFHPTGAVVCPTSDIPLAQRAPDTGGDSGPVFVGAEDIDRAAASPLDIALVETVGLIAAALSAALALRDSRGRTRHLHFPVLLAMLKLPTGALTAVLGLLLMRANVVPGLSELDSSAQIIAWAILLGYSQHLFTRLVDQQAHATIAAVRGSDCEVRTARGGSGRVTMT